MLRTSAVPESPTRILKSGECGRCKYPMRGVQMTRGVAICPECGELHAPAIMLASKVDNDQPYKWLRHKLIGAFLTLLLVVIAMLALVLLHMI